MISGANDYFRDVCRLIFHGAHGKVRLLGFMQTSASILEYSEDAISLPALDARHVACTSQGPEEIRRSVSSDCRTDTQRRCWRLKLCPHLVVQSGVRQCTAIEQPRHAQVLTVLRMWSVSLTTWDTRNNSNDRPGV